jgi:protease-4
MGQFLKQTFASLIGSLAGLFLFCGLGISGLAWLLITATLPEKELPVQGKSVLVFDLATEIRDSQLPTNLQQVIAGERQSTMTLRQVLQSLKKATKDPQIVGLFLDGSKEGSGDSGYATLAEVRTALEKFRSHGKKIIAYDVSWSEKEYYLASVADEVILNPMGMIELNGLSSQQMFFKEALEKYGIGVQVIRVGDYKGAVEPYTRTNFSTENREQTQALLSNIWQKFLTNVGESRNITPQQLQTIADTQGLVNPAEAKRSGLIDRVAYYDNVVADLKTLTGEKGKQELSFRQVNLSSYLANKAETTEESVSQPQIAVIYAEGSIVGGKGSIEQIGSDRFVKDLRQLREDKNVKAIVLRINSPGGSATASEIILREIVLTKAKKPIIVSMGNMAASGGYWISTGASQIFAEENTITGSIGVFGLLPNIQKIANNHGITWDTVKTAKFADTDSPTRPKTSQELAIYQKSVNQTYDLFLNKVVEHRHLSRDKVQAIAQGKVWSGTEAHKIGLVDRIGGLEAAIAFAAETAKLGDNWQLQEYPQQRNLESEILDRLLQVQVSEQLTSLDPITVEFLKFKQDLADFQTLSDPKGVYARLPFNFNFD